MPAPGELGLRGQETGQRWHHWACFFVGLGLALRVLRYALCFPLWCDEYQLAANLVDRRAHELLLPLHNNQVAPVGFLYVEWLLVRWLGFCEWSLRLFPLACGLCGVVLFHHLARRLLNGRACVAAVALFSVSYYPVRLACEVKPYASDLAMALVIMLLLVAHLRRPDRARTVWALAALAPGAMAVSYPSVFVLGAASLTLGARMVLDARRGKRPAGRTLLACLTFNLVLVAAFGLLLRLSHAQYRATAADMAASWADAFPPWREPARLVPWLVLAHTSEIFAYPVGAEHGGSLLTTVAFAIGCAALARRRGAMIVMFQLAAFGLTFVAACLERYPYGGHARLAQHLAPGICLCAGAGAARGLMRLARWGWQRLAWRCLLAGCLALAAGTAVRDVARPYKERVDQEHRAFARRLWADQPGWVTRCVNDELGPLLYAGSFDSAASCLRRMCMPNAPRNGPAEGARAGAAAERCVVYHSAAAHPSPRLGAWMQAMLARCRLVQTQSHRLPLAAHGHRGADHYTQCYDIYYFAPREP